MSRLTNEQRAAILHGLMRKTTFKKRFQDEIGRLGTQARLAHRQWMTERHGADMVEFIEAMPAAHKRVLCREVDRVELLSERREIRSMVRGLVEMLATEGYADASYYTSGLRRTTGLLINIDVPVFEPKDVWPYLLDVGDMADQLAPLEAIAKEFAASVAEVRAFLASVSTVDKLKTLMPEAVDLLPSKHHAIAVIPDASNAMAALMRAGFKASEEAAHG